jgi:formate--tetrahydrofolate ligase
MGNLRRHLSIVQDVYGLTPVVAVNRFPGDTDAEVEHVLRLCHHDGVRAHPATHVRDGGAGAEALARGVVEAVREGRSDMQFVYDEHLSLEKKAEALATRIYGAAGVAFEPRARRRLEQVEAEGFGHLPICVAKTQSSFSTDPTQRGAPTGHTIRVRDVRLAAGAGFVVLLTGDIMTMPGLAREPAAHRIDMDDDGRVTGLS